MRNLCLLSYRISKTMTTTRYNRHFKSDEGVGYCFSGSDMKKIGNQPMMGKVLVGIERCKIIAGGHVCITAISKHKRQMTKQIH